MIICSLLLLFFLIFKVNQCQNIFLWFPNVSIVLMETLTMNVEFGKQNVTGYEFIFRNFATLRKSKKKTLCPTISFYANWRKIILDFAGLKDSE